MEISIHSLLEGAARATGRVAIIDVFWAFTTAAVALAKGAAGIVMVRSVEEALAHRDAGIGQICRSPSIRSSERHEARAIDQVGITNGYQGRPKPAHRARPRRNLEISLYVKSTG
jgi:hypothetical protein